MECFSCRIKKVIASEQWQLLVLGKHKHNSTTAESSLQALLVHSRPYKHNGSSFFFEKLAGSAESYRVKTGAATSGKHKSNAGDMDLHRIRAAHAMGCRSKCSKWRTQMQSEAADKSSTLAFARQPTLMLGTNSRLAFLKLLSLSAGILHCCIVRSHIDVTSIWKLLTT